MTQIRNAVNRIINKKPNMDAGKSTCLGCGKHLAYCGEPFSAEIACSHCGAVNVYVDSQKPCEVRVQQEK
jgi:hypothetical protein